MLGQYYCLCQPKNLSVIKCQNKISRNIEERAYLKRQIGPLWDTMSL